MRIAFIGQKGIPVSQGGVERHVEEVAKRLAEKGHDVLVYSRRTYQKGHSVLPKGIKVIELPSVPLKAWDTILHNFLATLDVLFRKVDVINFESQGPSFYMPLPWLFKPKTLLVFTHHSKEERRPQWGLLSRLAIRIGEFMGVTFADEIVATGQPMAQDIKERYGKNSHVVLNGFYQAGLPAATLDLPAKYILTVSRLIRSKGLDHLINAFNLISHDFPDYHLVIAGGPTVNDNAEQELKNLAKGHEKIHFLGQVASEQLDALYSQAVVFAHPSEIEGLPMSVIEAASHSVPLVVSDIPEHLTIVGELGLLFKNKNHLSLAGQLRYALENQDEVKAMAAQLEQKIKNDFNWDKAVSDLEYIYSHGRINSTQLWPKKVTS